MFAIIESGGRQLKVGKGDVVTVDRVDAKPGEEVTLEQVLFVEKGDGDIVAGAPFVANAKILAVVDGEARGPKVRVFKKRRRKGFRKQAGHRAFYTRVRITDIVG